MTRRLLPTLKDGKSCDACGRPARFTFRLGGIWRFVCAGCKPRFVRLRNPRKARYKGGTRVLRRSTLHAKWSNRVRERDNWTCQKCGRYFPEGRARQGLDAAHVFGKGSHPSVKYLEENGVSLCAFRCQDGSGGHKNWAHQIGKEEWWAWNREHMGADRFGTLQARAMRDTEVKAQ